MSMHMASSGHSAIRNLSLSDLRCNNDSCLAFQAAHNLSQKLVSYARQYEYGHWTVWYYAMIIGLFAVWHLSWLYISQKSSVSPLSARGPHTSLRRPESVGTLQDKMVASMRYLSYRRCRGRVFDSLGLPSLGMLSLFLISVLFLLILTFAVRPYYRQHRGFGSPPLGVRTGLMAAALTPLTVALAGKANFVTLLTGIGHEKLNTVHRWVSWMLLGLSVAHTIPFIVAPLKDGGPRALHKQYYKHGGFEYTGTPALAVLVAIVLFSLPPVRHRFYESFYGLHIAMYIAYLGLCFWHFGNERDSWNYLWATLAIYLASIVARIFWKNRTWNVRNGKWFSPDTVSEHSESFDSGNVGIEVFALPGGMTRLSVPAPAGMPDWEPGQHCFLRFPCIDMFGNHPFTIASSSLSPALDSGLSSSPLVDHGGENGGYAGKPGRDRHLTFLIRAHSGFTRRLAASSTSQSTAIKTPSIWIEGAYGSAGYSPERTHDTIVLVAGGGGVSVTLAWLDHLTCLVSLASKPSSGPKFNEIKMRRLVFIWMVRHRSHLSWIEGALDAARERLGVACSKAEADGCADQKPHCLLETRIFVTRDGQNSPGDKLADNVSTDADRDVEKNMSLSAHTTTADANYIVASDKARSDALYDGAGNSLEDEIFIHERPKMSDLLPELILHPKPSTSKGTDAAKSSLSQGLDAAQTSIGDRVMVIGCGPQSLITDVSSTCADMQRFILSSSRGGIAEVALRTERFEW